VIRLSVAAAVLGMLTACFKAQPSRGGGEISEQEADDAARSVPDPSGIDVPRGYRIDLVADRLTFPTGIAFGGDGEIFAVESGYSYGNVFATPRILELPRAGAGKPRVAYAGKSHAPWNGIDYHEGAFFVAQGGHKEGGRIVRISRDGDLDVLVDGLPSKGDHHTNGPVVTDDGWVYFGQGTVTNAAVVGEDSDAFGWLRSNPTLADTPCKDLKLSGINFESKNPLTADPDDVVTTGPYKPFGTPARAGEVIGGKLPCNGAVRRVRGTGGDLELVAWGLRNPFGLVLGSGGELYVSDNGYDVRGSRPVFGAADMLWRIEPGPKQTWVGWPDYSEGRPLTLDFYAEADGDPKGAVLAEHPGEPPPPVAMFGVHSSANGLDISRSAAFGYQGDAFVALFGDMAPDTGKVIAPVGFKVVRVNLRNGVIEDFARNRGGAVGPASRNQKRGLERPIAVRFDPDGDALYIVDFGVLRMDEDPVPEKETGRIWRVTRETGNESDR
jgi:hypothetical protein